MADEEAATLFMSEGKTMSNANLTKRAIAESFRELLNETVFERITIKSICDRCGISRQTFYYHFHDAYDLVAWMLEDRLSLILREAYPNWRVATVRLLQALGDDKALVMRLARSADLLNLHRILGERVRPLMLLAMEQYQFTGGLDGHDCELAADFYAAGITKVAVTWLEEGCLESPAELAERIERIISIPANSSVEDIL